MSRDPAGLRELARVIGREKAGYLIGRLPRTYGGKRGKESWRVMLYVPKRLSPNDRLVRILGWRDAERLVAVFGGELLKLPTCARISRELRDATIRRYHARGISTHVLAQLFGLSERGIRYAIRRS